VNTPQQLPIPLGGSIRIEAFDQISNLCAALYDGDQVLRAVSVDANDLRAAAHALLDDLIDAPLPPEVTRPIQALPRMTPDDLHAILHVPVDLGGVTLEPLGTAQDAAEALRGIFDSLEEAFLDDALDPNGDEYFDERQRLRALQAAMTLFDLLAQRGA
jgi:hypothetical protein